ncbi:MAG: UvrB/UvrC motif-containing protein [Planctomycetes bacterium]|nr:UvrB/UvrC motif-containing protein [Planctomycetota bacterium]
MICQKCQKNEATVLVTEIEPAATSTEPQKPGVHELSLCEVCAQALDLPHAPAAKKSPVDIWKLLQLSANQARKKSGPACPSCGMTLEEFRKKGRLGCSRDYEVFRTELGEVLERVHGSVQHSGRIPGTSAGAPGDERVELLRQELEHAIRSEAYESAARLRDEIRALEGGGGV